MFIKVRWALTLNGDEYLLLLQVEDNSKLIVNSHVICRKQASMKQGEPEKQSQIEGKYK